MSKDLYSVFRLRFCFVLFRSRATKFIKRFDYNTIEHSTLTKEKEKRCILEWHGEKTEHNLNEECGWCCCCCCNSNSSTKSWNFIQSYEYISMTTWHFMSNSNSLNWILLCTSNVEWTSFFSIVRDILLHIWCLLTMCYIWNISSTFKLIF